MMLEDFLDSLGHTVAGTVETVADAWTRSTRAASTSPSSTCT
jgi:hypothetical protein